MVENICELTLHRELMGSKAITNSQAGIVRPWNKWGAEVLASLKPLISLLLAKYSYVHIVEIASVGALICNTDISSTWLFALVICFTRHSAVYSAKVTTIEMQPCHSSLASGDLEAFLRVIKWKLVGSGRGVRCGPYAPAKTSVLSSSGNVCMPCLDSVCVYVISYLLYFHVCLRLLGSCYNLLNL